MIQYEITSLKNESCAQAAFLHSTSFIRPWSQEEFCSLLTLPGTYGFEATSSQGHLYGFILLQNIAEDAEILTFVVSKNSRRKGIGTALLKASLQDLYLKGARRLLLEVSEDNKEALTLYNSFNFKAYGRRKNYYLLDNSKQADALLLQIQLNNQIEL